MKVPLGGRAHLTWLHQFTCLWPPEVRAALPPKAVSPGAPLPRGERDGRNTHQTRDAGGQGAGHPHHGCSGEKGVERVDYPRVTLHNSRGFSSGSRPARSRRPTTDSRP